MGSALVFAALLQALVSFQGLGSERHLPAPSVHQDPADVVEIKTFLKFYADAAVLPAEVMPDLKAIVQTESEWGHGERYIKNHGWGDDGKSYGLMQVQLGMHEADARRYWKARGEFLGENIEVPTMIAFGIYVYARCYKKAHGDRIRTLEFYNGIGPGSPEYAAKVTRRSKRF